MNKNIRLYYDTNLTKLKWKNVCSIDEAITETVEWYKKYEKDNEKMNEFSINQIKKYVTLARQRNLIWAK